MTRKKTILIITCAVLLLGAAILFFGRKNTVESYTTETATATIGDVSVVVTATGTVDPESSVDIGTQVSGIIDKLYVDYNSFVTKGQILAEMDKVMLQSDLLAQQASRDGAKAEYEYQQKNYLRKKALHEKQLISDIEYEEAEYSYAKAKSAYESSEAYLVKAKQNLEYATITSPIDGVVICRDVDEGQTVAAGFETPNLFTIASNFTLMQVTADVDEADIGRIANGQRVSFTVDAFPEDTFEGTVSQVRLEATVENNVVTYEVVIDAPNPDFKLRPGLTANVSIFVAERRDVINIPLKALHFTPDPSADNVEEASLAPDNKKTIWVKEGFEFKPRQVVAGMDDGVNVEICEGLEKGEIVAIGHQLQVGKSIPQPNGAQEQSPFMPKPPGKK